MKRFALLGALVVVLASTALCAFAATADAAPPATGSVAVPISTTQSGGILDGALAVTGITTNSAHQLLAVGTFNGTVTDLATGVVSQVTTPVSALIGSADASCSILDLTLGPLHLDLLGLVVDLNQVHLTITAVPGPGNLLGNLLGAVTHLLDGGVPTVAVSNLLNNLLGRL